MSYGFKDDKSKVEMEIHSITLGQNLTIPSGRYSIYIPLHAGADPTKCVLASFYINAMNQGDTLNSDWVTNTITFIEKDGAPVCAIFGHNKGNGNITMGSSTEIKYLYFG